MKRRFMFAAIAAISLVTVAGCSGRQQSAAPMAPPLGQSAPLAAPLNGGMNGNMQGNAAPQGGVYNWQDVPANQQVGIARAQFDQGGYQLVTDSGDTIVVPFVNQNLYVMRFGRSRGQTYFVNENGAPTLYLPQGVGLANAAAQGALWYPIPNDFNYSQPMYVGLAPSWNDYVNMGWYPGMAVYGGMWGYNPYHYSWMPGFVINIGGSRYTDWGGYTTYYGAHPGYYRSTVVYNNYNTARRGAGSYRYTGSSSSGSGSFARPSGSFNSGNTSFNRPSGSFGNRATTGGSFGNGARPSGAFGNSGSFGNGTRPPSSFGGSFTRPSSSFGGGRSSGGSFGGGGRSFGGGRRR